VLFSKTHGRILTPPRLAALDTALPDDVAPRSPLRRAWRRLQAELDIFIDAGIAAA
jgi:hypothetical protein